MWLGRCWSRYGAPLSATGEHARRRLAIPTSIISTLPSCQHCFPEQLMLGLVPRGRHLIDDASASSKPFRRIQDKGNRLEGASRGTAEIALPTGHAAVDRNHFRPGEFMEGRVGRFFQSFGPHPAAAIMVVYSCSRSRLPPAISARVLRRRPAEQAHGGGSIAARSGLHAVLAWSLDTGVIVMVCSPSSSRRCRSSTWSARLTSKGPTRARSRSRASPGRCTSPRRRAPWKDRGALWGLRGVTNVLSDDRRPTGRV